MKTVIYVFIGAMIFLLMPVADTSAEKNDLTIDAHGMLLGCENKTRESHLYLMNAKKLELSDEQIKELRDIKGGCDKVCVVEKVRLRVAKVELTAILETKVVDMALAKEKIRLISDLQDSLRIRHLKTKVRAMMVLSESQKEKAGNLKNSI